MAETQHHPLVGERAGGFSFLPSFARAASTLRTAVPNLSGEESTTMIVSGGRTWRTSLVCMTALLAVFVASCQAPATEPTPTSPAVPTATTAARPNTPAPAQTPTAAAAAQPLTAVDGAGKSITLASKPTKIVSLAPSNTEILFALGLGQQVVGVSNYCDYPAEAKNKKKVVGLDMRANREEIAQLAPDLVLAAGITNQDDVKALEALQLKVFTVGKPMVGAATVEDVIADIESVGRITGTSDKANRIAADMRRRVEAITTVTKTASKPTVFFELDATEPSKPFTPGPGSFIDGLITMAGGQNIAADAKMPWAQLSSEEIVSRNPDLIVLGDAKYGVTKEQVAGRPGWSAIKAVQNGAIFEIDDDLVSRPGPRVVEGLEQLAKIFHPQLFK